MARRKTMEYYKADSLTGTARRDFELNGIDGGMLDDGGRRDRLSKELAGYIGSRNWFAVEQWKKDRIAEGWPLATVNKLVGSAIGKAAVTL